MTAARHHTFALALLAACGLRPYTFDGASGDATSTASSASTAGTAATAAVTGATTASPLTTTTTTGSAVGSAWRGLYHSTSVDGIDIDHAFLDCTTQQLVQLRGDLLPEHCHEVKSGWGLYLHVLAVLHPDGDDPDTLDELEVLDLLDEPCEAGSCDPPFDWYWCGPWSDVCGCDVWTQDCPEGQKCVPFSLDGDHSYDALKCVPVAPGAGGAGAPCTTENGGVDGLDTCAKGYVCWPPDEDTEGACIPQCTGTVVEPMCPDCMSCAISQLAVLTFCFPDCDPLLQECASSETCIASPSHPEDFLCVLDGSGDEGQIFDPCEYANACDPGLWCAPPEHASECDPNAPGCCLPFCDLTQPTCPGAGLQCVPWSDQTPPCSANVGTCRLPP